MIKNRPHGELVEPPPPRSCLLPLVFGVIGAVSPPMRPHSNFPAGPQNLLHFSVLNCFRVHFQVHLKSAGKLWNKAGISIEVASAQTREAPQTA